MTKAKQLHGCFVLHTPACNAGLADGLVTESKPILAQVENEYGYCGSDADYIRHLLRTAKAALGDDVIFYTTDPPSLAEAGSLPGDELYT